MEFDTGKAILTVVISWIIVFAISLVIGAVFGLGSMVF
jgi:TM2 domain-containing membrane protein YozV